MSVQLVPIVDKNGVATSRWKKSDVDAGTGASFVPAMRSAAERSLFASDVPLTIKGAHIDVPLQSELKQPFDPQHFTEVLNEDVNKPRSTGLWAAERTEGTSWWQSINGAWERPMVRHEVRFHPQANVLVLDSWQDYADAVQQWPMPLESNPDLLRLDYEAMTEAGVDAIYLTAQGRNTCDGRGDDDDQHEGIAMLFRWELPSVCFTNPDAVVIEGQQTISPRVRVLITERDRSYGQYLDEIPDFYTTGVYRIEVDGKKQDLVVTGSKASILDEKTPEHFFHEHPDAAFIEAVRTARYFGMDQEIEAMYALRDKHLVAGSGRNRCTFDRGDGWVIKVAITPEGNVDIEREATHDNPEIPLATCWTEDYQGIQVLIMEEVTPYTQPEHELPGWCSEVDCHQVGYTADGRLVAYDL